MFRKNTNTETQASTWEDRRPEGQEQGMKWAVSAVWKLQLKSANPKAGCWFLLSFFSFSVKNQIKHILHSVGHPVTFSTAQLMAAFLVSSVREE